MATKVLVNGKLVSAPGVYSVTTSGVVNPPIGLPYGNILIVDNGSGAGFGGGSGIAGAVQKGKDAIYQFTDINSFRNFVKGGVWWNLAKPLFQPAPGVNGVSKIFWVKAATTTQATIAFTLTHGAISFKTLDEGVIANGTLVSSKLVTGYGAQLVPGVIDSTKYIMKFYLGTYRGFDSVNNVPYQYLNTASPALLLTQSPEVATVGELAAWMNSDAGFQSLFGTVTFTAGALDPLDISSLYPGINVATGATETYDSLTSVLSAITTLDYSFILSESYGANAQNSYNSLLLDHILNTAKYEKQLVIGGGQDAAHFLSTVSLSSAATAAFYNSDRVIVVHGGPKKKKAGGGFLTYNTLYKAAYVLGRICGLQPQDPITLKSLDIDGEVHSLYQSDIEYALENGVMTTYYDDELGKFVAGQGINTLLNNDFLINSDGTSFSIQIRRITAQLNKDLVVNMKKAFFDVNVGPNRSTVTPESLQTWVEGFLQSRLNSGLIVDFGNITISVNQDNYNIKYYFVPSFEISKMINTGVLVDSL